MWAVHLVDHSLLHKVVMLTLHLVNTIMKSHSVLMLKALLSVRIDLMYDLIKDLEWDLELIILTML